ncbi:MAG: hypothetical protein ABSH50_33185 [Bryobacteraceae bacterium]|jgi:hypothetical protein
MRALDRRLRKLEVGLLPAAETDASRQYYDVMLEVARNRARMRGEPLPTEVAGLEWTYQIRTIGEIIRTELQRIVSRLARLERETRTSTGPRRFRIQYGYLKTLPGDYTGPRHTVTVKQLATDSDGHEWFEWEERPGPEPPANAADPAETIIHVCYIEAKPMV